MSYLKLFAAPREFTKLEGIAAATHGGRFNGRLYVTVPRGLNVQVFTRTRACSTFSLDVYIVEEYNVDVADVLGLFEQAVLLALVKPTTELGKQAYGRAIFNEVQTRLNREVAAGAVYATLDRLEQKGLISSRIIEGRGEQSNASRGGNPRRYYSIEAAGVKALNEAKAATERLWDGVRWPVKGIA